MTIVDEATRELVRRALEEDVGSGDITTNATVPDDHTSHASIVGREEGVLAGLKVAQEVFLELDRELRFSPVLSDGERVAPSQVVANLTGRTRAILTGERVALNFLQRLSGIATLTAEYVALLDGARTRVLDTRKTTPGLRALEKYAVTVGGGANHRLGLWDMALIKDNHIAAAGGIAEAVKGVRASCPGVAIEVEVRSLGELREALGAAVDRIMLDNMSVPEMKEAIELARAREDPPEIEISGGVTPAGLLEIAGLEPDYVSVGALTHSARALDLSLELGGA